MRWHVELYRAEGTVKNACKKVWRLRYVKDGGRRIEGKRECLELADIVEYAFEIRDRMAEVKNQKQETADGKR
jgi:hypothetical protein